MPNVDQLTEAQLWNSVCLATKEKEGIWSHRDCKGMSVCQNLLADGSPVPPTTDCHGTGRVWALSGMQEKCRNGRCQQHPDCVGGCHGTGYVAKRDLGALFISVIPLDAVYPSVVEAVAGLTIHQPAEHILRAIAKALVAQGGELGAT